MLALRHQKLTVHYFFLCDTFLCMILNDYYYLLFYKYTVFFHKKSNSTTEMLLSLTIF